jgi:hypothetical protein
MSDLACENCRTRLAVAPVTFVDADQRVTQRLCEQCKETLLGRRRARHAPAHRRRRRRRGGRLSKTVREGGPAAYLGVGLFLVGLVLVPTLILVSLLSRK